MDKRSVREEFKRRIKDAAKETSNIASAINVGNNKSASTSSRQRVVQRDGVTTTVTETREERRDR